MEFLQSFKIEKTFPGFINLNVKNDWRRGKRAEMSGVQTFQLPYHPVHCLPGPCRELVLKKSLWEKLLMCSVTVCGG